MTNQIRLLFNEMQCIISKVLSKKNWNTSKSLHDVTYGKSTELIETYGR